VSAGFADFVMVTASAVVIIGQLLLWIRDR
jgi:hypothetical protein